MIDPRNHTNRSRAAAIDTTTRFETLLLLAVAVCLALAAVQGSGALLHSELRTQDVRVEPGQTLWSLAKQYPVEGADTARTVEIIASLNGLSDGVIQAGSTVRVPVTNTEQGAVALR